MLITIDYLHYTWYLIVNMLFILNKYLNWKKICKKTHIHKKNGVPYIS